MVDFSLPPKPLSEAEIVGLTLEKAEKAAFFLLGEAVHEPRSPLHWPVLATLDEGHPRARTVILRRMETAPPALILWTDARSAKFGQIRKEPRAEMVFYDPSREIQLRVSGKASVVAHEEAEGLWRSATLASRRAYLVTAAPGSISSDPTSGLPSDAVGVIPDEKRIEEGRDNFAAIRLVMTEMDLLILSRHGHRRAVFRPQADSWEGQWLIP
ncbi:MAG: hypothetical protein GC184_13115 [Rhizobiales bacterium]|nr:hypothetical protein [Hyphomicrobiales bacterium]